MSPDQPPKEKYMCECPKCGTRFTAEPPQRRHGDQWYHMTPWRLALIAAWLVIIVTSIRNEVNTNRIDNIASDGRTAICVEVKFLENSRRTTEQAIAANPGAAENVVRQQSVERLSDLVRDLREAVPGCPPLE